MLCLSPHAMFWFLDGTTDSQHRDQDEGMDGSAAPPLVDNVVPRYFPHITVELP